MITCVYCGHHTLPPKYFHHGDENVPLTNNTHYKYVHAMPRVKGYHIAESAMFGGGGRSQGQYKTCWRVKGEFWLASQLAKLTQPLNGIHSSSYVTTILLCNNYIIM